MKTNILINNELLQGDSTPEKIINPVNSELIVEVPQSSEEQVNKAVAAAKKAFVTWSKTTPGERSSMLLKLADHIDSKAEEIAKLESLNTGKPFHLALNDELPTTYSIQAHGNAVNNECSVTYVMPDYMPTSVYRLNYIMMTDLAMNKSSTYFTTPSDIGAEFTNNAEADEIAPEIYLQTSNPDITPPELVYRLIPVKLKFLSYILKCDNEISPKSNDHFKFSPYSSGVISLKIVALGVGDDSSGTPIG